MATSSCTNISEPPGTADTLGRLRVFYDGSCPLCRREIAFLARQHGADEALALEDISQCQATHVTTGLSRTQAMARMHVQRPTGEIVSGARAFIAMWGALERYRRVSRWLSTPPIPFVLEGAYRAFLVIRPLLQRLAR
ncbi:MAG: DUF393 domain-containing protein [Pseudomonadota bacterium]